MKRTEIEMDNSSVKPATCLAVLTYDPFKGTEQES